ncbi:MAG: nucleotidyltransferase domain-containing protein [Phormidesmis sp.]
MLNELIRVTSSIFSTRYPQAEAIFLAGSVVRDEGTSTSDLDLVVVFERLPCAYRGSYCYENWPIEAFVHDPQTLDYFFRYVDRPTGVPSLARMVAEGIEVPMANEFTHSLKQLANSVLHDGPPLWSKQDIDDSRYGITDLVEDIRDARSVEEMYAIATLLYPALADHYLRRQNLWSAKGKAIPRRLQTVDSDFAKRFSDSFESVFADSRSEKVIDIAAEILDADGGFLFEGHRLEAPQSWRIE